MDAVSGELRGIAGMVGSGGAEDGEIGFGGLHAGSKIGKNAVGGDVEGGDGALHGGGVGIEYASDFGIGVFMHKAQKITHVHVIKADADNAGFGHGFSLSVTVGEADEQGGDGKDDKAEQDAAHAFGHLQ